MILLLLQLAAADARGPAVFKARVAAFDARARELADARGIETRGKAALAWLESLRHEVIWRLHDEHRTSAAADDIAWIGATTGIPGECEGYIPCYSFGLNYTEGEYLRRHPGGRHVVNALEQISKTVNVSVDDLLSRPDRNDFLKTPDDCGDLQASLTPLREAVSAVAHSSASSALIAIDRLRAYCPRP